jgi:hypothetical protein
MGSGRTCAVSMVGQNTKVRTGEESLNFQSDMTFWSHEPEGTTHVTQEDIYNELGVPFMRGSLLGYNGCLMAYGQTGAGKSHSIVGSPGQPGILPRIVEGLLQECSSSVGGGTGGTSSGSNTGGFELRVWFSAIEIFSERCRDLLIGIGEDSDRAEEPAIVQHPTLGVQVIGAIEAPCLEATDIRQLLDYASKKRAVAAGNVGGALSSRSHAFFYVRLDVRSGGRSMHSRLTLVDLAGSERSGTSNPSPASASQKSKFARQGRSINRSLSTLSWIVKELSEGSSSSSRSVYFQTSKLTLALKDALSGNSRTWLLAALSPGT